MGPWRNLAFGLLVMAAVGVMIFLWPRELTPSSPQPPMVDQGPLAPLNLPEEDDIDETPVRLVPRRERPAPTKNSPPRPGHGVASDLLDSLRDCLALTPADPRQGVSENLGGVVKLLSFEDFQLSLEKDLGPAMAQGDLWTEWVVRLAGGLDRKIHLENRETPEGQIQRRLSVYQLDQSGKTQALKIEGMEQENPSLQVISSLLNEGEVLRKETSKYFQYTGGERLELIEVDSHPVELEIVRGEVFFRCDHLTSPDACTCIR